LVRTREEGKAGAAELKSGLYATEAKLLHTLVPEADFLATVALHHVALKEHKPIIATDTAAPRPIIPSGRPGNKRRDTLEEQNWSSSML
jgi:hypothetical protein